MAEKKMFRFRVNADVNELQRVLNFVEGCVQGIDCSPKAMMRISVAVEEIFVNRKTSAAAKISREKKSALSTVLTFLLKRK